MSGSKATGIDDFAAVRSGWPTTSVEPGELGYRASSIDVATRTWPFPTTELVEPLTAISTASEASQEAARQLRIAAQELQEDRRALALAQENIISAEAAYRTAHEQMVTATAALKAAMEKTP